MSSHVHAFHIPVMGTGFSLDTPIRIACFGIDSVMSIVDDTLIERVRRHYCATSGVEYQPLPARAPDARARRITTWLDLVHALIQRQLAEVRALPFAPGNDKTKYFELLPDGALKRTYIKFIAMPAGDERRRMEAALTGAMVAGSADVNIMTKLDRARYDHDGLALGPEYADAKAALRGFAASCLESNLVLSAGMNPTLFGMLERFPSFYRDPHGYISKGVVLKVSDFRSALVQGRFLAKKGIEVREFRIESGLNCGGHAFATEGELLGPILAEFRERRESFPETFEPTIRQYYEKRGWEFAGESRRIRVTVQGGIGTSGEVRRLCEHYGVDGTGWATPFLLVPEATALDGATRRRLAEAKEEDLYVSDVSPLGVAFNNLRGSSSEVWTTRHIDAGRPGSSCPHAYLASNTEFTETPICTASHEYQRAKLASMGFDKPPPSDSSDPRVRRLYEKTCICHHLGNGLLIDLGVARSDLPVAVCPGPNIAYFDREYTLREMVDHIYGRGPSLVPASRPHMLATELRMYVDHFSRLIDRLVPGDAKAMTKLGTFKQNLELGLTHYRELAAGSAFDGENLASLAEAIEAQAHRIEEAWSRACSQAGQKGPEDVRAPRPEHPSA